MTDTTRKGVRAKATKAPARAAAAKPAKAPAKQDSKSKPGALTAIQEQFVLEYIKDFNGLRAAKAIKPHLTDAAAGTEAWRLLKIAEVQAAIAEKRQAIAARMELSAERTMQEIARLAYFDPRKLFNPDGSPKPINELDDDTAAALAGMDVQEEFEGSGEDRRFVGYTKKYKVADKNAALDKAAKILGLFQKDNEQAGDALGTALAKFVSQFHRNDAGRLKVSRD